jgi:hypothetical protein
MAKRQGNPRRRGPYWVGWLIGDVLRGLDGSNDESLGYWLDQIAQAVQVRNWYAVSLALARANNTRYRLKSKVLEYQMSAQLDTSPEGEDDGRQNGEEGGETTSGGA